MHNEFDKLTPLIFSIISTEFEKHLHTNLYELSGVASFANTLIFIRSWLSVFVIIS